MQVRNIQQFSFILILLTIFTLPLLKTSEPMASEAGVDYGNLEQKVAALELGFGDYHIAHKLNQTQKEKAQAALLDTSYSGTYTFVDGDINILVEKDVDTILAIYKKNEKANKEDLKQMVAALMARFENPTSEAHDQIIYWAFDDTGKISDTRYKDLKQGDEKGILATVKFKSKLTFTEIDGENDLENSIHCIVSSPRLLERFYQQESIEQPSVVPAPSGLKLE